MNLSNSEAHPLDAGFLAVSDQSPYQQFGYDEKLQLCFCSTHKSYYKTVGTFKEHLRKSHHLRTHQVDEVSKYVGVQKAQAKVLSPAEVKIRDRYLKYDKDCESDLVKDGKYPNEILPRLDVLEVSPAFMCDYCFLIIPNKQKISSHKKECGSTVSKISSQALFLSKNRIPFRVVDQADIGENSTHWLLDMFVDQSSTWKPDSTESTVSEVDFLVRALRCSEHLKEFGLGMEEAWGLCRFQEAYMDHQVENQLYRLVGKLLEDTRTVYKRNVYAKSHKYYGRYINICLTDATHVDYQKKVASLIYFLHNLISIDERSSESGGWSRRVHPSIASDYLLVLGEVKDNGVTKKATELLHNLFFGMLFTQDGPFSVIIPLFITCRLVHQDNAEEGLYHFGNGSDISHVLSPLACLGQSTAIQEAYGYNTRGESSSLEGYHFVDPSQHRSSRLDWGAISNPSGENLDCAAGYIRYCQDQCLSLRENESMEVRFVVCQKHVDCGLLDGQELALSQIGKSVQSRQQKMWKRIDQHLLCGFLAQINGSFWELADSFMDNFSDRSVGYWFAEHSANKNVISEWSGYFIRHLISNVGGFIGKKRFCIDNGWRKKFVEQTEELTNDLFWLMQITGGGPARASELQKCQFRNSSCTGRHIYIEQGRLVYVLFGHKGRDKMMSCKPIARFPDIETSRLLICFLLFIRPLDSIVAKCSDPAASDSPPVVAKEHETLSTFLFVSNNAIVSVDILRRSFGRIMKSEVGEEWSVRQYRQYHAGVIKAFSSKTQHQEEGSVSEEYLTNFLHYQSGHSVATANETYGVAEVNMKKLDSVTMENWRKASQKWQYMIGIGEHGDKSRYGSHCSSGSASNGLLRRKTDGAPSSEFEDIRKMLLSMQETMLSRLCKVEELLKCSRNVQTPEADIGSKRNSVSRKRNFNEIASESPGIGQLSRMQILNGLRKLFGKEVSEFRDLQQEKCLTSCCNAEKDHLVILPTGSGKSLTFMIQPFVRMEQLSVVIVPLVSLKMDILRRCKERGIIAVDWADRDMHGAKIVVCSCEHVVKNSYAAFIKGNWKSGKLFAIFVDEVHLLKQWLDFRPIFNRMASRIRPSSVKVPVIALTATCPPQMEATLQNLLGFEEPASVIRGRCTRRNISYSVSETKEKHPIELLVNMFSDDAGAEAWPKSASRKKKKMLYFVSTRAETFELYQKVSIITTIFQKTFVGVYHAGMSKAEREEVVRQWISQEYDKYIIVATSAFGCGIDYPDISVVIHYGCPQSLMRFLQESGRAGRDGGPAKSIVLYEQGELDRNVSCGSCSNSTEETGDSAEDSIVEEDRFMKTAEHWEHSTADSSMFGEIRGWVELKDGCRRTILDEFSDGQSSTQNCFERGLQPCDLCLQQFGEKYQDQCTEKPVQHSIRKEPRSLQNDSKNPPPGTAQETRGGGPSPMWTVATSKLCTTPRVGESTSGVFQPKSPRTPFQKTRHPPRMLRFSSPSTFRSGTVQIKPADRPSSMVVSPRLPASNSLDPSPFQRKGTSVDNHGESVDLLGNFNGGSHKSAEKTSPEKSRSNICGKRSTLSLGISKSSTGKSMQPTSQNTSLVQQTFPFTPSKKKLNFGTASISGSPDPLQRQQFRSNSENTASERAKQVRGRQEGQPSKDISHSTIMDVIAGLKSICALCSIKYGRKVCHCNGLPDEQKCQEYLGHCFRCSSGSHKVSECFILNFRQQSGFCYQCSMSTHKFSNLHSPSEFGKKTCPIKNAIRVLVACFEHCDSRRKLNEQYPEVMSMSEPSQFIAWLRISDSENNTRFAEVLQWVVSEIISN